MFIKGLHAILASNKAWKQRVYQLIHFLKNTMCDGVVSFNLNSKRYWDEKLNSFGDFWRDENYHHIVDLFPRNEEFRLLDIGCALGDGCEYLQKQFPLAHIEGVDFSDIAIHKAQSKRSIVTYRVLDVLTAPISQQFDYITIVQTLEHFDQPFKVLDKCLSKAKKAVIVSVPYTPEYSGSLMNIVDEHRYCFNEKTFAGYNARVVKITDFVASTQNRCIVYEIKPT